jgi:hypothetical protein
MDIFQKNTCAQVSGLAYIHLRIDLVLLHLQPSANMVSNVRITTIFFLAGHNHCLRVIFKQFLGLSGSIFASYFLPSVPPDTLHG